MNDRGKRIEEGKGVASRLGCDGVREPGAGQRACRDDRRMIGQPIDLLTHEVDVGVMFDRAGYLPSEGVAVDRER